VGTRAAAACFVAGIGLLTVTDAAWAHAVGVVCLFGFVVAAFRAIVPPALADGAPAAAGATTSTPDRSSPVDRLRRRPETHID
jgi:hypothetical protein